MVLSPDVIQQLKQLKEHAIHNEYTLPQLLDIYTGKALSPGDFAEFRVEVPVGYVVVFTIENAPLVDKGASDMHVAITHNSKTVRVRHLTMSIDRARLPHPEIVRVIMPHLGFESPLEKCIVDELSDPVPCISVREVIGASNNDI
jgi:hypothetical protein